MRSRRVVLWSDAATLDVRPSCSSLGEIRTPQPTTPASPTSPLSTPGSFCCAILLHRDLARCRRAHQPEEPTGADGSLHPRILALSDPVHKPVSPDWFHPSCAASPAQPFSSTSPSPPRAASRSAMVVPAFFSFSACKRHATLVRGFSGWMPLLALLAAMR